jgi:hypothetical protein
MREKCLTVNKMKIYEDVLEMLASLKFVQHTQPVVMETIAKDVSAKQSPIRE